MQWNNKITPKKMIDKTPKKHQLEWYRYILIIEKKTITNSIDATMTLTILNFQFYKSITITLHATK